ncbi:hypothetical protein BKA70DRAFT_1558918 [Coprinopsis sp. MPI-PUGE-AT-0042]|nr:hypothetical protein BKA70DRAFT_1558918 [Coprinopsis sp. MPI-PUGE-AT-0042]
MVDTRMSSYLSNPALVADSLVNLVDSMSDPRITYRTREEVQRMRSNWQDPNRVLQKHLEECGCCAIDEEAKTVVDAAFQKAKSSPEPTVKDLSSGTYYKGTKLDMMRAQEREGFHRF